MEKLYEFAKRNDTASILQNLHDQLDIQQVDEEGNTLLHLLAGHGNKQGCSFVLMHGCPMDIVNNQGHSALSIAAKGGYRNVVNWMISNGADVDGNGGLSPLIAAVDGQQLDIVVALMDCGVKLNVQDKDGNTALHVAAKWGNYEIVQELVKAGARLDVRNENGQTVMEVASPELDIDTCFEHRMVENNDGEDGVEKVNEGYESAFGMSIAKGLVALKWIARSEAYNELETGIREKTFVVQDEPFMDALCATIERGMQDTVSLVAQSALSLYLQLLITYGRSVQDSSQGHTDMLLGAIKSVADRLGDTNVKLREDATDAFFIIAKQTYISLPKIVNQYFVSQQANDGSSLLISKLTILAGLIQEYGIVAAVHSESDTTSKTIQAEPALELAKSTVAHRDAAVRSASVAVFLAAVKSNPKLTISSIKTMRPELRNRIISKLQGEAANLIPNMESDRELARPGSPFVMERPGTSTATKHRPPLVNLDVHRSSMSVSIETNSNDKVDSLPYGGALTAEQLEDYENIVETFGEETLRCLLDKNWSQREAGILGVTSNILASVQSPASGVDNDAANNISPGSANLLMVVSEILDIALNDSVARVYQSALKLLQTMVDEYVPTIRGAAYIAKSALQQSIHAVVGKLNDPKERIRTDSQNMLQLLAGSPAVGYQSILEIVLASAENIEKLSTNSLVCTLNVLQELLANATDPQFNTVLLCFELLDKTLCHKQLKVRLASVDLYAGIYQALCDADNLVPDRLKLIDIAKQRLQGLRPNIREAITEKTMNIAVLNVEVSEADVSKRESSIDFAQLTNCFGISVANMLESSSGPNRALGMGNLCNVLLEGKYSDQLNWEFCILLVKHYLLDDFAPVQHESLKLLKLMVKSSLTTTAYSIPWGNFEVQMLLGSAGKTIAKYLGHKCIRIRETIQTLLVDMFSRHDVGKTIVARILLEEKVVQSVNTLNPSQHRLELGKQIRALTTKLRSISTLATLQVLPPHGGKGLSAFRIYEFVAGILGHPSQCIQTLSEGLIQITLDAGGQQAAEYFLKECGVDVKREMLDTFPSLGNKFNNTISFSDPIQRTTNRRNSRTRRPNALQAPQLNNNSLARYDEEKLRSPKSIPLPEFSSKNNALARSLSKNQDGTPEPCVISKGGDSVPLWLQNGESRASRREESGFRFRQGTDTRIELPTEKDTRVNAPEFAGRRRPRSLTSPQNNE